MTLEQLLDQVTNHSVTCRCGVVLDSIAGARTHFSYGHFSPLLPSVSKTDLTADLTQKQREHITSLAASWTLLMAKKYSDGVREHGGNLWEKDEAYLLDQALMENIDQFVYLWTLKQKKEGLL